VTTLSDKKLKEAYLRVRAIYAGEGDEEGIGELVPQEVKEMSAAQIKQAKQSIKDRHSLHISGFDYYVSLKLALTAGFEDLTKDLISATYTGGSDLFAKLGGRPGRRTMPGAVEQAQFRLADLIDRAKEKGFEDLVKDLETRRPAGI
jgi:hypothetical protein